MAIAPLQVAVAAPYKNQFKFCTGSLLKKYQGYCISDAFNVNGYELSPKNQKIGIHFEMEIMEI